MTDNNKANILSDIFTGEINIRGPVPGINGLISPYLAILFSEPKAELIFTDPQNIDGQSQNSQLFNAKSLREIMGDNKKYSAHDCETAKIALQQLQACDQP